MLDDIKKELESKGLTKGNKIQRDRFRKLMSEVLSLVPSESDVGKLIATLNIYNQELLENLSKGMMPKAMIALADILESGSDTAKLKAIEMLMDRAYGRPDQKVTQTNHNHFYVDAPPNESREDWLKRKTIDVTPEKTDTLS